MDSVYRLWDPCFGLVVGKFCPVWGRGMGQSWGTRSSLVPLLCLPFNPSEMSLIKCGQDKCLHTWPLPLPQLMAGLPELKSETLDSYL